MNLYTLATEYHVLMETLEGLNLDEQTVIDSIEGSGIMDDIQAKVVNMVKLTKNIGATLPAVDAEIKRLKELKTQREESIDGIKKYIIECLNTAGLSKIHDDLFTVSIAKNPSSVVIGDTSLIPSEYWIQKPAPEPEVSKTLLGNDLKLGKEIAGASLQSSVRLSIK